MSTHGPTPLHPSDACFYGDAWWSYQDRQLFTCSEDGHWQEARPSPLAAGCGGFVLALVLVSTLAWLEIKRKRRYWA